MVLLSMKTITKLKIRLHAMNIKLGVFMRQSDEPEMTFKQEMLDTVQDMLIIVLVVLFIGFFLVVA